jgi:hypothetical protein
VESLFGLAGGTQRNIAGATPGARTVSHGATPGAGVTLPSQPGGTGTQIPAHTGYSTVENAQGTRLDLYNLSTGKKYMSANYENTTEGKAQMKASMIALGKKTQLERL